MDSVIVGFDELKWSDSPCIEKRLIRREHYSGEMIELPAARIRGARDGPQFAITSGMHSGEYAGILAAQELISVIKPKDLVGTVLVVPVISTRAFMERCMQLSPVDDKELHFLRPGNPRGSYSEMVIDTLFGIVKDSNYLIDSHGGEMVQALYPWVPVPMQGPEEIQQKSLSLAKGFNINHVELRRDESAIPPLCSAFLDAGIANIWVECGKNGVPSEQDVKIHFEGYIAALQTVGMLQGEPARPEQEVLEGKRYQINATFSGVWHPVIKEGDIVDKGQYLGKITDYFGHTLEEVHAPSRSLVLYYWTSPAINIDRRPYGYDWHSGLVSLLKFGG